MRILPELEFLNGLPVDRDALNESIHSSQQKHRGQVDEIPEEEAEADENTQQLTEQSRVEVEPTLNTYQSAQNINVESDSQQQLIGQHLDTAELEAIAICYDNIRLMRRRLPNNNDFELGQKFDLALRHMMDKLSAELQNTKTGEMKARAAIVSKQELMQLLVQASHQYLEKTDPQCASVTSEIIK